MIVFPKCSQMRLWIINLNQDDNLKTPEDIARFLGLRLSVVKAVIKRGW